MGIFFSDFIFAKVLQLKNRFLRVFLFAQPLSP